MWGGDIELIEIASLYNLAITVHQQTDRGMVVRPTIGPRDGRGIDLWYSGDHYENYDRSTGGHTDVITSYSIHYTKLYDTA